MPIPLSGTYARSPARRVLTCPDPRLATRAEEVDPRSAEIVRLAEDLVATMRLSPACVGLAANQIGELSRVFCMDVTGHKKARSCAGLVVLVNPRIVASVGSVSMREGCMSVPHFTGDVPRAEIITVEGFAPGTGERVRVVADAMEARCLLHEIDHLDGHVFLDRATESFARKRYA